MLTRWLSAAPAWQGWRSAIAVFCAAVFLFVGFAHALQHYQEPVAVALVDIEAAGPNVASEPVDGAAAVPHCFGCVVIGLPTPVPIMVLLQTSTKFPWPLPDPARHQFAATEGPIPITAT